MLAKKLSKKPENKFSDLISCNNKNSKSFLAFINILRFSRLYQNKQIPFIFYLLYVDKEQTEVQKDI